MSESKENESQRSAEGRQRARRASLGDNDKRARERGRSQRRARSRQVETPRRGCHSEGPRACDEFGRGRDSSELDYDGDYESTINKNYKKTGTETWFSLYCFT